MIMTFDLGEVSRSRSWANVHGHRMKKFFPAMDARSKVILCPS